MYLTPQWGEHFHPKGYIFSENGPSQHAYGLVIGSSNLTTRGLKTNVEWNLKISAARESPLACGVLSEFECLCQSRSTHPYSDCRRDYLRQYHEHKALSRAASGAPQGEAEEKAPSAITPNLMQQKFVRRLKELAAEGSTGPC